MAWFSKLKKKILARRNAMEHIAKQLDMQFHAKEAFSSVPLLKDFYLFRTNYKKGITNIISGSNKDDDEHYKIFDYKYVIQAGNTPVVFQQTVLFIESKNLNLPKLHYFPRSKSTRWFYKIEFLARKGPTVNEQFNQKYKIRKTNLEDGRMKALLDNAFLETVLQNDWIHIEGNNYHFIIYYHSKILNDQGVKKLFQAGLQFIHQIKDQS